jgi:hypothetical protein
MPRTVQKFAITYILTLSVPPSVGERPFTPKNIEDQLSFQDVEGDLADAVDTSFSDWNATGGEGAQPKAKKVELQSIAEVR